MILLCTLTTLSGPLIKTYPIIEEAFYPSVAGCVSLKHPCGNWSELMLINDYKIEII